MTTELKPCPFCRADKSRLEGMSNRYVRCGNENCDAMGPNAKTEEEAARLWDAAPRKSAASVPTALPVTKTLHDEYTMAALTGLLAYSVNEMPNGNYHSNCSVDGCIQDARKYADAAMKARGT